jgi:ribosomal protein L9
VPRFSYASGGAAGKITDTRVSSAAMATGIGLDRSHVARSEALHDAGHHAASLSMRG